MKYLIIITSALLLTLNGKAQKKLENQVPIDIEPFFNKLISLELNTWNYKGEKERTYGLPGEQLVKSFGTDSKGKMTESDLFSVDTKIGLNFTAIWVLAKTVQKLLDENSDLKSQINSLNDNILHIQGVHSDVMTMMQEYDKIKMMESKMLELSTQIIDLQQEIKTLKEHNRR
jgi:regulator of replication initiation timing